jgi:hypothetical protein
MFNLATIRVYHNGVELAGPEITANNDQYQLRFTADSDWGSPLDPTSRVQEFELRLTYPDRTDVQLVLAAHSDFGTAAGALGAPARAVTSRMSGSTTLRIAKIVVDEGREGGSEKPTDAVHGLEGSTTPVSAVDIPLPPRAAE